MKATIFLTRLLLLFTVIFASCDLINPDEESPAYIYIEEFEFNTTENEQGTASEKITELWVYANDEILGVYDLPANIPVLKTGTVDITVRPGIKNNGISATRIVYPLYTEFDTQVDLKAFETDTIVPTFTYKDDLTYYLVEDFEVANSIQMVSGSEVDMIRISDPDQVFEGNGSGLVSIGEDQNLYVGSSSDNLPLSHVRQSWAEVNYKSTNSWAFGLFASNGVTSAQYLAVVINPTTDDAGEAQWNKIYIDLSGITSTTPDATEYEVYIEAAKDASNDVATLWFDNIKIVSF